MSNLSPKNTNEDEQIIDSRQYFTFNLEIHTNSEVLVCSDVTNADLNSD